jgi:hypothetical protein
MPRRTLKVLQRFTVTAPKRRPSEGSFSEYVEVRMIFAAAFELVDFVL